MRRVVLVALVGCGRLRFDPLGDGGGGSGTDASVIDVPTSSVDGAVGIVCASRTALGVAENSRVSGNTANLTMDSAGSCGGATVFDQMYAVDVPEGGAILAAFDGPMTTEDTLLHFRTICDLPGTQVACDAEGGRQQYAALRTGPLSAGRYWLYADGNAPTSGIYEGTIQTLLPLGAVCIESRPRDRCALDSQCLNGTCQPALCPAEAVVTSIPFDRLVTTTGHPNNHAGSCGEGNDGGARSPEVVFELTLASAVANLHISTDHPETSYDTLIYVRSACNGPDLSCSDNAVGNNAVIDTGPLSAGTYEIFIDGFGAEHGQTRVTID